MLLFRRIVAVLLTFMAMLACLLAVGNQGLNNHSIENAQRLDRQFKATARSIEQFQQSHGRLPSPKEIGAILPQTNLGPYEIMFPMAGFDQCVLDPDKFRSLQGDDYILAAWRGEWFECYAPTKNLSTLALDPAEYTMLGAVWLDTLGFLGVAALFIASA